MQTPEAADHGGSSSALAPAAWSISTSVSTASHFPWMQCWPCLSQPLGVQASEPSQNHKARKNSTAYWNRNDGPLNHVLPTPGLSLQALARTKLLRTLGALPDFAITPAPSPLTLSGLLPFPWDSPQLQGISLPLFSSAHSTVLLFHWDPTHLFPWLCHTFSSPLTSLMLL